MTAKEQFNGEIPVRYRPGRKYLTLICRETEQICTHCDKCYEQQGAASCLSDTQQATSSLTKIATMTAIAGNIAAATGITGSISAVNVAQKARISR
jgi:hypothetical protein